MNFGTIAVGGENEEERNNIAEMLSNISFISIYFSVLSILKNN